ncbi:hypothetical protein ACN2MM_02390 [Alkalilimnicola ehrlichii MLHE-1]|uniref:Uncharacterized protein n=1 Tax=Alkalilimnicola ehrlichii (strain ATCC BAA-1101 / DSM 17681 / MLHE-1) TaxID=187272 RepID=Q0ABR0_ALKEH|nr:hypothetical protein [Alkalilimnicola ehrlichii]ABI55727.1 hypothetical protein Mlg_0372 [Alkalilimnicola ehrlichii MLHE-1]
MQSAKSGDPNPTHQQEINRLRRELQEARARLAEDAAYYRAELEASRQRIENRHLRSQASEVAKRRRAEESLAHLRGELKRTKAELTQLREQHEELTQKLLDQEEALQGRAGVDPERVHEASRAAWANTEQELHRIRTENERLRKALSRERTLRRQLEATLSRIHAAGRHQRREPLRGAPQPAGSIGTSRAGRGQYQELSARGIQSVYQAYLRPTGAQEEYRRPSDPGGFSEQMPRLRRAQDESIWQQQRVPLPVDDIDESFLELPSDRSIQATDEDTESDPKA